MTADCRFAKSDRGLAMRNDAEHAVNRQVQQEIHHDGDDQRYHQGVAAVGAGTANNAAKWTIERIRDGNDKLDKSGAAARCQ